MKTNIRTSTFQSCCTFNTLHVYPWTEAPSSSSAPRCCGSFRPTALPSTVNVETIDVDWTDSGVWISGFEMELLYLQVSRESHVCDVNGLRTVAMAGVVGGLEKAHQ